MDFNGFWNSPWRDEDVAKYMGQMRRRYGSAALTVNKPLRLSFLLSATQGIETSGNGPAIVDCIAAAENANPTSGPSAAGATDDVTTHWPGSPTTRTQNPSLNAGGVVPQNQSLLIGGVRGVIHLGLLEARAFDADPSSPAGSWIATGAMQDTLNGVLSAFEASELIIMDQTLVKGEVFGGDMFAIAPTKVVLMGPAVTATSTTDGDSTETVTDEMLYGGTVGNKQAIGRRLVAPVFLDGGGGTPARPQSTLKAQLIIPRKTAWPIQSGGAIRIDLILDSLWTYNPSAGVAVCDPGDGGAGGTGPGYIKPDRPDEDERW